MRPSVGGTLKLTTIDIIQSYFGSIELKNKAKLIISVQSTVKIGSVLKQYLLVEFTKTSIVVIGKKSLESYLISISYRYCMET